MLLLIQIQWEEICFLLIAISKGTYSILGILQPYSKIIGKSIELKDAEAPKIVGMNQYLLPKFNWKKSIISY